MLACRTTSGLGVRRTVRPWLLTLLLACGLGLTPGVAAAQDPSCGGPSIGTSFASLAVSDSVADPQADCYPLTDLESGDIVQRRATGNVVLTIRDADDNLTCSPWSGEYCQLSGRAPWRLVVTAGTSPAPVSYGVVVRRLTDPSGCEPLGAPEVWSFAQPRVDAAVTTHLQGRCFLFNRAPQEEDGTYWFRAIRTTGTIQPVWRVYGPTGGEECRGSSAGYQACALLASGRFALVVDDDNGADTGTFLISPRKVTAPAGCTPVGSDSFAAPPTSGDIAKAGEIDCHVLPAVSAGDRMDIGFQGSGQWTLVDGQGNAICDRGSDWRPCVITGVGPWSMLTYDAGAGTPAYSFSVRRITNPKGCVALGTPDVWSFAAPRIDGTIDGSLMARCYTFTRAAGEPDGSYWFRTVRTSGALNPRWRVFGPSGDQECEGAASSGQRCQLLATGQFVLVVNDGNRSQTGSFYLTARRTSDPAGCSGLPSVKFGEAPVSGQMAVAGDTDCHSIPSVSPGQRVQVAYSGPPGRWELVDGAGNRQCSSTGTGDCTLGGSGPYAVLVFGEQTDTFPYELAVRRLTKPEGCTPLGAPEVWSFTAPRVNGTVSAELGAACYVFTRPGGEPDASYWFRAVRTSGEATPYWRVLSPTGNEECSGSSQPVQRCQLLATGQFAVLVEASGAGSFFLAPRRLNAPTGCSDLPTAAFGIPAVTGNLSTGGEVDCYKIAVSEGDVLKFNESGAADRLSVIDPDGAPRCGGSGSTCTIGESGTHAVLVYSTSGTGTGSYKFQATCENVPCGQSETALTDTVPARIGQSRYTTVMVRGRDLELLETIRLIRGSTVITGELQPAAPDGRAADVRFNLDGAPLGKWTLEGTFIDGTTRTLADAVTVEALRAPDVAVELVGREAYRIGTPTSVTVTVTNTGNADAIGVPVVLRGVPADATVEPVFDVVDPSGSASSPTLKPAEFDQGLDTTVAKDGRVVPFFVARVPAGRSVPMEYRITATTPSDFTLRAYGGACLATEAPGAGRSVSAPRATLDGDTVNCMGAVAGGVFELATNFVPFGGCVSTAAGLITDAAVDAGGGDNFWSWDNAFGWAIDAADCGVDIGLAFVPGGLLAKSALDLADAATDVASGGKAVYDLVDDCLVMDSESSMRQRAVTSIDPNEIRGPVGAGEARYIPGNEVLTYQVLFENLPAATAPAQRVTISNSLDKLSFDTSSVLFTDVRFGSTVYTLPYPSSEIDETIDLRPAQDLKVHVTAGVTGAGQVHWELQAIDPETLQPPADPLVGFLPPNHEAPAGEGSVSYTVNLKSLPSGAEVSNQASIRFDTNAPIETPTWRNKIDKLPPASSVSAEGVADPSTAKVAWSGSDDAAGISLWEIRVSRDGGPFELWRTATAPGTDTFVAETTGTYIFRTIAHDGAGNVGQSPLAGVDLSATDVPPDTTILSGPDDGSRIATAVATFTFNASKPDVTFACSIDGAPFAECSAPYTTPAMSNGSHTFAVRAKDAGGRVDETAATRRFDVEVAGPPPPPPLVVDSDRDGVSDDLDRCPLQPGSATDGGCPAQVAASCVVPRLKGLTLSQAKKALRAADCRLGKVKKPKRAKRLTVATQTIKAGAPVPVGTRVGLRLKATKKKTAKR